jgi:hypothetical protein
MTDTQALEQQCESEIDCLYKTINDQESEYDKQLLTLSSAMLGVSLAFIKDVVKLENAAWMIVLYAAWVAFGLCILGVLFSFQFSIKGHYGAIAYWRQRKKGAASPKFPTQFASLVNWVNWVCGALFLLGVSCLIFFVIFNLSREGKLKESKPASGIVGIARDAAHIRVPSDVIEKGAHIKQPDLTPAQSPAPTTTPANTGNTSGNSGGKDQ